MYRTDKPTSPLGPKLRLEKERKRRCQERFQQGWERVKAQKAKRELEEREARKTPYPEGTVKDRLWVLLKEESEGLSDYEASARLKVGYESLSRRRREMVKDGYVVERPQEESPHRKWGLVSQSNVSELDEFVTRLKRMIG